MELIDQEEVRTLPILSYHAQKRGQQRSYSPTEMAYVLEYGRLIQRTGTYFYFLAAKDIPNADRKLEWVRRLIGTTVLTSPDTQAVITLYRNHKALRVIKKKSKRKSLFCYDC